MNDLLVLLAGLLVSYLNYGYICGQFKIHFLFLLTSFNLPIAINHRILMDG